MSSKWLNTKVCVLIMAVYIIVNYILGCMYGYLVNYNAKCIAPLLLASLRTFYQSYGHACSCIHYFVMELRPQKILKLCDTKYSYKVHTSCCTSRVMFPQN